MTDLLALALDFDARLEGREWGSPAEYYLIGDGEFTLLWTLLEHPADSLQTAWDQGKRAANAEALALITEGWRHLTLEEMAERHPDYFSDLLNEARARVADFDLPVDPEALMEDSWAEVLKTVAPAVMPVTLRTEVRNAVVIGRDGTQVYVIRERDGEPVALPTIPPEHITESRVPDYMHQFLNGKRPTE